MALGVMGATNFGGPCSHTSCRSGVPSATPSSDTSCYTGVPRATPNSDTSCCLGVPRATPSSDPWFGGPMTSFRFCESLEGFTELSRLSTQGLAYCRSGKRCVGRGPAGCPSRVLVSPCPLVESCRQHVSQVDARQHSLAPGDTHLSLVSGASVGGSLTQAQLTSVTAPADVKLMSCGPKPQP